MSLSSQVIRLKLHWNLSGLSHGNTSPTNRSKGIAKENKHVSYMQLLVLWAFSIILFYYLGTTFRRLDTVSVLR
jgi:hypothetical protein